MIGKIYIGVASAIFTGGCVFFGKDTQEVLPLITMCSLGWPIIVSSNLIGFFGRISS